jgi:hypothetical protein
MPTLFKRKLIAIGTILFSTIFVVSIGHAQGEATRKACSASSPYSPASSLAVAGIENCQEVVHEIERAIIAFFNAECRLLEAWRQSMDPRSYAVADQLIDTARTEFTQAGELFSKIAKEIDNNLKLTAGEQTGDANLIIRIYGFNPPRSYRDAFEILATKRWGCR